MHQRPGLGLYPLVATFDEKAADACAPAREYQPFQDRTIEDRAAGAKRTPQNRSLDTTVRLAGGAALNRCFDVLDGPRS